MKYYYQRRQSQQKQQIYLRIRKLALDWFPCSQRTIRRLKTTGTLKPKTVMKTFILIISPAWPSKTGKREHSSAVKAIKEIGWHKMAPNTFRGSAKSAEAFEKMMRGCVPHAANWRLHEVCGDHLMTGGDWSRGVATKEA